MIKIKPIVIGSSLILALLFLNKFGLFKNPLLGAVVLILILFIFPITWQIKEYIKKKNPNIVFLDRCRFCGFEFPEDETHCQNCGKGVDDDEFAEDIKEKKICPYCGLKELETIYEISRGYKEVCASCGKSRVSRKAIKITLYMFAYFAAIALFFYFMYIFYKP
jgi:DNA-directed RNA polymerase subunit RPC12/RpoP